MVRKNIAKLTALIGMTLATTCGVGRADTLGIDAQEIYGSSSTEAVLFMNNTGEKLSELGFDFTGILPEGSYTLRVNEAMWDETGNPDDQTHKFIANDIGWEPDTYNGIYIDYDSGINIDVAKARDRKKAFGWAVDPNGNRYPEVFEVYNLDGLFASNNDISNVPEPGTLCLVALGLGAAAYNRRRKEE